MGCEQSAPVIHDKEVKNGKGCNPATSPDDTPCCSPTTSRKGFTYTKNTCGLEYWEPIRFLGEGSISSIHLVRRRPHRVDVPYKEKADIMRAAASTSQGDIDENDPSYCVMKSILKNHVRNDKYLDEMRSEIYTMSRLCHPNICSVTEAYERKRHIYLIMEYCRGGDLCERGKMSEAEAATVIRKLLSAIAYMHQHGVVHRDLKLENIMFDKDPSLPTAELKIIDFGLATRFLSKEYKNMTAKVGTLYSMAPQVLQGVYDAKCDIWSVGVVTYILLTGMQPFWGPPQEMSWEKRKKIMIDRIMRCDYMKMKGPTWDKISPEAKKFVESLLQMVPGRRPTAEKALKHPWIVKYQDYKSTQMPRQDEQYAKKMQLKRAALVLISQELAEDEIVQLKNSLLEHDHSDGDRITLQHFHDALVDTTSLSSSQVEKLFNGKELKMDEYMPYVGLLNEALDRKLQLQEELIQEVFSQCGSELSCQLSKERLRAILEKSSSVSKATMQAVMEAVDSAANEETVSCQQVVSHLKQMEMERVKVISTCRDLGQSSSNLPNNTNDGDDGSDEELADETNAVIPGGRQDPNVKPKFVYDDASQSVRKTRCDEDLSSSAAC